MKHRILIVSYLFPPMGGIAVQRAMSLAKYLPGCGFEVHVLTARNAAGPVYDPGLLKNVPEAVTVHRAFTPEIPFGVRQQIWKAMGRGPKASAATAVKPVKKSPFLAVAQRVLCPEPEIAWVPFALRAARRIVKEHAIDCVLVTVPPFSALLVGATLKRENPALTLVSDFRDEWLTFYLNNNDYQNNPHARRRAPEIERAAVEASDLVVAVNHSSLREIRLRYPEEPEAKFACVPNGYDPDVFASFKARSHAETTVLVTHAGTVYKNASPRYFRQALEALPEAVRSRVATRFVGRVAEEERGWLDNWPGRVEMMDFLPQAAALKVMEETDYLLVTMTDPISIPGKLYEYLATGKPVIAFTPPGSEVWQFFEETGAGWCLDPAEPERNASVLAALFAGSGDARVAGEKRVEAIRRYARSNLAVEYAERIGRAMATRR